MLCSISWNTELDYVPLIAFHSYSILVNISSWNFLHLKEQGLNFISRCQAKVIAAPKRPKPLIFLKNLTCYSIFMVRFVTNIQKRTRNNFSSLQEKKRWNLSTSVNTLKWNCNGLTWIIFYIYILTNHMLTKLASRKIFQQLKSVCPFSTTGISSYR